MQMFVLIAASVQHIGSQNNVKFFTTNGFFQVLQTASTQFTLVQWNVVSHECGNGIEFKSRFGWMMNGQFRGTVLPGINRWKTRGKTNLKKYALDANEVERHL